MGVRSNYTNGLYKDYEILQIKYDNKVKENSSLLLRAIIAEDNEARLQKLVSQKEIENEKLKQENDELQKELERLKARENNDGTNSGIPTSMTPINKKKVIPNFAKNTGGKIGRKKGHK